MDSNTPNRRPGGATTPLSPNSSSIAGGNTAGKPGASIPGRGSRSPSTGVSGTDPRGLTSTILVLCRWLQSLSIALWMGAILCLGMIVAPYAVTYFNSRVDAGKFLGPLFYKLTLGGVICGVVYVLLLLVHDSLWKRYHPTAVGGILTFLRFVLAVGMVGASAYLLIRAYPAMEQYQKVAQVVNGAFTGGAGRAFDYWHALYKTITSSVFGAGLALLLLTHMSHKRR